MQKCCYVSFTSCLLLSWIFYCFCYIFFFSATWIISQFSDILLLLHQWVLTEKWLFWLLSYHFSLPKTKASQTACSSWPSPWMWTPKLCNSLLSPTGSLCWELGDRARGEEVKGEGRVLPTCWRKGLLARVFGINTKNFEILENCIGFVIFV